MCCCSDECWISIGGNGGASSSSARPPNQLLLFDLLEVVDWLLLRPKNDLRRSVFLSKSSGVCDRLHDMGSSVVTAVPGRAGCASDAELCNGGTAGISSSTLRFPPNQLRRFFKLLSDFCFAIPGRLCRCSVVSGSAVRGCLEAP